MDRAAKEDLVASLNRTFRETAVVVVSHYKGLTVAEMGELRRQMRAVGALVKVTKNRLAKRALEGTRYQGLDSLFQGPTAVTFSNDPVGTAKAALAYAKTNAKLVILGGGIAGQVLDADGIKALSQLPSIEELRAKLLGVLVAPASRLPGILQAPAAQVVGILPAPAAQLARVLQAYATKTEAA
jgi:large subunit ribosomal protein L10